MSTAMMGSQLQADDVQAERNLVQRRHALDRNHCWGITLPSESLGTVCFQAPVGSTMKATNRTALFAQIGGRQCGDKCVSWLRSEKQPRGVFILPGLRIPLAKSTAAGPPNKQGKKMLAGRRKAMWASSGRSGSRTRGFALRSSSASSCPNPLGWL